MKTVFNTRADADSGVQTRRLQQRDFLAGLGDGG
jgi:hypothetical protein